MPKVYLCPNCGYPHARRRMSLKSRLAIRGRLDRVQRRKLAAWIAADKASREARDA